MTPLSDQRPQHVLLLDDDPDEYFLLQSAFEELGLLHVHLTPCQDFDELINAMEKMGSADILFLDINLPKMDGIHCLKELKKNEKFRSVPIIIYSNSSYPQTIGECFEFGATGYLKKSSSFSKLKKDLQTVMAWNPSSVLERPAEERTLLY